MDMNAIKGTQSIAFSESPYLVSAGSVAGKKEGEGPLGKYFDIASEDDLFGEKTWELAEGTMQKLACMLALKNAGVQPEEVRYLFGGDLLRQGIATSMGAEELQIPVFGLFGACSTSGEALALAAMTVAAGYGDLVLAATSSHFGSAEKEFRFPLGYANQRPLSSHMDSDRKRSLSGRQKSTKPGADQWGDDWKNCGLWTEGFTEYGSVYGTGSV